MHRCTGFDKNSRGKILLTLMILENLNTPDLRCYKRASFTVTLCGNGRRKFSFQLIITISENTLFPADWRCRVSRRSVGWSTRAEQQGLPLTVLNEKKSSGRATLCLRPKGQRPPVPSPWCVSCLSEQLKQA